MPFLQIGAHSPSQSKEQDTVKTNFHEHAHTHARTHTHTHTHTKSIGQPEEVRFQRCEWFWWSNFARETSKHWNSTPKSIPKLQYYYYRISTKLKKKYIYIYTSDFVPCSFKVGRPALDTKVQCKVSLENLYKDNQCTRSQVNLRVNDTYHF